MVSPCRILIIDDSKDAADSLMLLLRSYSKQHDLGYEIQCAYSADEARRVAVEFKPDVILLDLAMPIIDGYTVGKEMIAQYPKCRVVAITGLSHPNHVKQSRENGFKYHLLKPVDPDLLHAIVREQCELERQHPCEECE